MRKEKRSKKLQEGSLLKNLRDHFYQSSPSDQEFFQSFSTKKIKRFQTLACPFFWTLIALSSPLSAATFTVTNTNDSGTGSFRQAIINANGSTDTTNIISFVNAAQITTLNSSLPPITASGLTIQGNENDIFCTGQGLVYLTEHATSPGLNIQQLNVAFANMTGATGGTGSGGGGGGLGAGGGLFVSPGIDVTLTEVSFNNCSVTGGRGGSGSTTTATPTGGGGGAGYGGAGGTAIVGSGSGGGAGGGGLFTVGGNSASESGGGGASDTLPGNASSGFTGGAGANGSSGGVGGAGGTQSNLNGGNGTGTGGGGGGSTNVAQLLGGSGGNSNYGGGGGGFSSSVTGNGGTSSALYGGGGGAGGSDDPGGSFNGTAGGGSRYGGGGGSGSAKVTMFGTGRGGSGFYGGAGGNGINTGASASTSFLGGSGGVSNFGVVGGAGGGGAGLGGAIFFDGQGTGKTLFLEQPGSFSSNSATGGVQGAVGNGGTAGQGLGGDIFFPSGDFVNVSIINSTSFNQISGDGLGGTNGGLIVQGSSALNSILTLSGVNNYSGSTTLIGPVTVVIPADNSLGTTVNGSGKVYLNGTAGPAVIEVTNSFTTSRNISISGSGVVQGIASDIYTINGTITDGINGSGSLTITPPGTGSFKTILTGTNTYSGGTLVKQGAALQVPTDASLGAAGQPITFLGIGIQSDSLIFTASSNPAVGRPMILNDTNFNTQIVASSGTTVTLAGAISGPGGLILPGPGTIDLTGNNSYGSISPAFGTSFTGGNLNISGNTALGAGALALAGGGTLGVIGASGSSFTYSNPINVTSATNLMSAPGVIGTFTGPITETGAGTLTITSGTIGIQGNNPNITSVHVSGGVLQSAGTDPLGGSTSNVTLSGGSLELVANGIYDNKFTFSGSGTIQVDNGTTSIFSSSSTFNGTTPLSLTGQAGGVGTLKLLANNLATYSQSITIGPNVLLQVASPGALGTGQLIFGGGTLELEAPGSTYPNPIDVASAGTVILDSGTTNGFSGNITGTSGALSLVNSTPGVGVSTLTLSGDNHLFTGGINIGPTVVLDVTTATNLGAGTVTSTGGTLGLLGSDTFANPFNLGTNGITISSTNANTLSGNISGVLGGSNESLTYIGQGGDLTLSGNNTYAGGTNVGNGGPSVTTLTIAGMNNIGTGPVSLNVGYVEVTASGTLSNNFNLTGNNGIETDPGTLVALTGTIAGPGELSKIGTGTLRLTSTNTYSGGTVLAQGLLQTAGTNPVGTGTFTYGSGALELIGNGTYSNPFVLQDPGFVVTADPGTTSFFNGNISQIGGSFDLTKAGTGTLYLNGSSTYTGATTVSAGALYVNGSITSATTVAAGASFGGTGTVGSIDLFGTLIPGNTLGTLPTNPSGSLTAFHTTFEPGSTFQVLLNGQYSSSLQIAGGDVSIRTGAALNPVLNPYLPMSYVIINDPSGTITGQFLPISPGTSRFPVTVSYFPHQVIVTVAEIPFATLLPEGNLHNIGVCFDALTTSLTPFEQELDPALALLNNLTTSELAAAFNQVDPALYNILAYAEQSVAERIRKIYTLHAFDRNLDCSLCGGIWVSGFVESVKQRGNGRFTSDSGYDDKFSGVVVGLDTMTCSNVLVSTGFSYARSHLKWLNADSRSGIDSYTAFLGASLPSYPYALDAYFGYTYHNVSGNRIIDIAPSAVNPPPAPTPFTPAVFTTPFIADVTHDSGSHTFVNHLGAYCKTFLPQCSIYALSFLNIDYLYVHQQGFSEKGAGLLGMTIREKRSDLFRPELGIGFGFIAPFYTDTVFGDLSVSLVREVRFTGDATDASFIGNSCTFRVHGILPGQNLICPVARFGVSTCLGLDLAVEYEGAFGKQYHQNDAKVELTYVF